MIVCAVFALLCGVMGGRLAAKASCGFAHNLREDMYNNLQTFSFANIDNYSTASLITRITTDVTNVQNAYQMAIRMLVRAPILFIASIIMTVIIEPVMALIFGCIYNYFFRIDAVNFSLCKLLELADDKRHKERNNNFHYRFADHKKRTQNRLFFILFYAFKQSFYHNYFSPLRVSISSITLSKRFLKIFCSSSDNAD